MFIILIVLMTASAIFLIGYPLFKNEDRHGFFEDLETGDDIHNLIAKKEETYIAIKDMDFDYMTGKLSEEDYQELKNKYRIKALNIIKDMDKKDKEKTGNIDDDLEKEILDVRKEKVLEVKDETKCHACASQIFPEDKFCASCGAEISLFPLCRSCGRKIEAGDKFCSSCGEKV